MRQGYVTAIALCFGVLVLEAAASAGADELVYIGTHGTAGKTAAPAGSAQGSPAQQGIYAARLDTKTGHLSPLGLATELQRATWLVIHPTLPVIYSMAQSADGMAADSNIHSFRIDKATGALHQINVVDAGGHDSTHLAFDSASNTLFSANYGSGNVTALPVLADGSLGEVASEQKDYGSGPHPRQKSAIAHGVTVDRTHQWVLVTDFGADRIFVYHFDKATRKLTPATTPFTPVAPGSGPRHPVFHPDGKTLYFNNELSGEIRAYHWDSRGGTLTPQQSVSPYPADYSGERSAAEIGLSRDGRFLYLSLRGGQDSVLVYAVDKLSGNLTEIQRISSQGKVPWSFGIDASGRWMLVTNEASNSVAVLKVDPVTGMLAATDESLSIPNPVAVAFYSH